MAEKYLAVIDYLLYNYSKNLNICANLFGENTIIDIEISRINCQRITHIAGT